MNNRTQFHLLMILPRVIGKSQQFVTVGRYKTREQAEKAKEGKTRNPRSQFGIERNVFVIREFGINLS